MGFKLRPAGGRSGLFLCPAWLTCPVLTFLQVRVGAGPGCAPTVQRPDLSAPVPCQPPLPPSLEEEVHQGLGALQGPLLPRGPRLLLPPLFLLLCRHEGAPGGLEGWAEGKDEGQGCGEGQRKGRVGGRRDLQPCGEVGMSTGLGFLFQLSTPPPPHSYSYVRSVCVCVCLSVGRAGNSGMEGLG